MVTLRDLILLTVYHSKDYGEHSCLATRLHKVIFLLKQMFPLLLKNIPEPEPGPFGPYFRGMIDELQKLKEDGLIEIEEIERPRESDKDTGIMRLIRLTNKGIREASELEFKLKGDKRYRKLIERIEKYSQTNLWELLYVVYSLYPEYTEKSKIRDRVYRYA